MLRASLVLFLILASCASTERMVSPTPEKEFNRTEKHISYGKIDISGMSKIAEGEYLVVHDTKYASSKPRLGIITIKEDSGPEYSSLSTGDVDWKHEDGPSNDLESVCRLPLYDGYQFLIAESGKYDGKYGRIFHIKLFQNENKKWEVTVESAIPLPERIRNVEGMGCFHATTENSKIRKLYVLLGERGGKKFKYKKISDGETEKILSECGIPNENVGIKEGKKLPECGKILLWELDLKKSQFIGIKPKNVFSFSAPDWSIQAKNRDISDIHIDSEKVLWISSAEDPGDFGPFKSIIYNAGKIDPDSETPIPNLNGEIKAEKVWELDGIKVESIAAPSFPGSGLSIGTDDENYGGIWRPLLKQDEN